MFETNELRFLGGGHTINIMTEMVQNQQAAMKEILRQHARAGVITEAEAQHVPGFQRGDVDTSSKTLSNPALVCLLAFNRPYRTLVQLLLGMHSANIRTNKGSVYRIRFVARNTPHGVPDPSAPKTAKSTSDSDIPTSAAYPLLTGPAMQAHVGIRPTGHEIDEMEDEMDKEFSEAIKSELEALKELSVSDSSSVTDTNWFDGNSRKANERMYTLQWNLSHMLSEVAGEKKV